MAELIALVSRELGLVKSLPVPGGGNISYVVEEVWVDGDTESAFLHILYCYLRLTTSS